MGLFSFVGKAVKAVAGTVAKVAKIGIGIATGAQPQQLPPAPQPFYLPSPSYLDPSAITQQTQNQSVMDQIRALTDTVGRVVNAVKQPAPPAPLPPPPPPALASSGFQLPSWAPIAAAVVVAVLLLRKR